MNICAAANKTLSSIFVQKPFNSEAFQFRIKKQNKVNDNVEVTIVSYYYAGYFKALNLFN